MVSEDRCSSSAESYGAGCKLLDALEDELTGQGNGYRLHDAYVARIFDLWDLLQVATRTLS